MPQVNAIVEAHRVSVDFVTVYIEEAHASDEWPIYQVDIPQHRDLEERIRLAQSFKLDFDVHLNMDFLADSMENEFNREYASWPFRFWVLEQNVSGSPVKIAFKAMPKESKYRLEDLTDFLSATSTNSRNVLQE